MRAFIGIDFAKELKKEISELQQRLRRYAVKGRWKYIDNLHLTLKFLGEINQMQQGQIDEAVKKICYEKKPFSLKVTGLGVFAGRNAIRVLWLGLAGDTEKLHTLQKDIDEALEPRGFSPEKRKFKPHITIGQNIVFKCSVDQIRKTLGEIQFDMIEVDRLFLFQSKQVQNKRVYSKVTKYDFAKQFEI